MHTALVGDPRILACVVAIYMPEGGLERVAGLLGGGHKGALFQ